jgi:DNA-binding winged helix-turn-helix (wHTH) protein
MRYAFGDFVLDDDTRLLLQSGREVPLGSKVFELLELLVRSRPRALSRTRLRAALWPATHVGPTSLHVLVSQLRAALGDDAQAPDWVRTVHGFGYAFRGDVRDEGSRDDRPRAATTDRLWLSLDGQVWALQEGENVLGREAGVAVRIERGGVSRRHALITVRGGRATLQDLGSRNGTSVGEERVLIPRPLRDGDVITLGRRTLVVFRQDDRDATESDASTD